MLMHMFFIVSYVDNHSSTTKKKKKMSVISNTLFIMVELLDVTN